MKTGIILLSISIIFLSSCVSLNHINDYSRASISGLLQYNDLHTGFEQNCLDNCQTRAIQKGEINPKLVCDCSKFSTADSVTQALNNIVTAYFIGLAKFSDSKLTNYDLNPLIGRIKSANWLDDNHSKACVDIGNVLFQATTNTFRRGKLIAYIEQANSPIQIIIKKLQSNLKNDLYPSLERKSKNITEFYRDAVSDSTISDYQKAKIAEDYYDKLSRNSIKAKEILTYCNTLDAIAQGHQKLYENRAKANSQEIKTWLIQSATDLKFIYSDIIKLKNQ